MKLLFQPNCFYCNDIDYPGNHCISKWGGPTVGYLPELAPLTPGRRIVLNVWPNPEPKDSECMEKKQQKIRKPVSGSLPLSQASINRNVVRPMEVLESRTGIFRCKVCKVDIVCAEDLVTKGALQLLPPERSVVGYRRSLSRSDEPSVTHNDVVTLSWPIVHLQSSSESSPQIYQAVTGAG
ncbi:hypothetical protein TIFTF001_013088 [Ficus carica]|uniref:Uncharacterized protein n=1 Tax=Ficus carica TaxID=3494 RepID=A0AA88D4A0_FICCA|nr:hypothetical protein TIFTF001_013088 [Ficus carica]